jgi:serine/threonine protein kinase/formylglycine-generating enzyme required for sulfatase activity/Leucine-rich repeat (LRR) protein
MSKSPQAETLFFAALEKETAEERTTFLDSACAGDVELRHLVEKLLRAHLQVGDFLQQPVVEQLPPITTPTAPTRLHDAETPDGEQRDVEEATLAFLTPSTRSDSLGRLGHYEVLEVLGHGGFGIVFRAFDETLQRVVAVKVLSPQLAVTSPARKRFLREARSSAKVRHQNVVQVYSVEEQPLPYLVMEFIPGETLQQRIDRTGPFELDEVVQIGRQIAEGLAAAHAQGVIHRDIKPANILVEDGVTPCVKITDFGLARAADDASLTQSGAIAGTPMFMAPEQARGETLDQRADLFSLGSVLYTICSGRPPFRAPNTVAVLKRVAEDTPRPIPEIIPEVPSWLCDVIARLHAKRPEDRIATAREVADLLADDAAAMQRPTNVPLLLDEGLPTADRPVWNKAGSFAPTLTSTSVPALRPRSRIPRWTVAGMVLLLCIAGLGFAEGTGVTNFRGTVIRLFSPEGTLVVEVDDPEVSVQIDGSDLVITGAGVKEIRLKAGQHTVEARKDGQLVRRELTTVTRNGRQVVRINQEPPADMQVAKVGNKDSNARIESTPTSPEANDPDRRAAEYVLSIGGAVQLTNRPDFIDAAPKLPPEAFQLITVHLLSNAQPTDAGLALLKDCPNLQQVRLTGSAQVTDTGISHLKDCQSLIGLGLDGTKVTDKGLASFKGFTKLVYLSLSDTQISDAGLASFNGCKGLKFLQLNDLRISDAGLESFQGCQDLMALTLINTTVGDAGLAHFRICDKLTILALNGTHVTDSGLAYFTRCKDLTHLNLANTNVTDAGLVHLQGLKNLKTLDLKQTQVTPQGISALKQALPGCQIELDTDPDRDAAEYVLSIGGVVQVNDKADELRALSDLPPGAFRLTGAFLALNQQVTDAGLARFKDCENLAHLDLNGTPVTDAGLAHFAKCKNLASLELPSTTVTAAGLAWFKDCKNLTKLNLCFTSVGDAGLAHFKNCKKLVVLDLNSTQATDAALAPFTDLRNLEILHLHATQVGDGCLENFKGCEKLWSLDLGATRVTDAGLAHLRDCKKLRFIYLQNTAVTDAGMVHFEGCEDLLGVELQQTKVGDGGLGHLQDSANLTWLHLSGTAVTDAGLAHLKDRKNLKSLNLPNTQVSDAGLVHLRGLKNLSSLDLRQTQVTAQGVADLKQALPDCTIEWEQQVARGPADAPSPAIAPFDAKSARTHQEAWAKYLGVKVEYTNRIGMQFILIPPGEFTMGSPPAEIDAVLPFAFDNNFWADSIRSEAPEHKVILTQPFYLGIHEVTQGQYQQVMEANPSRFAPTGTLKDQVAGMDTAKHPVEMVVWLDAVEFCSRLNQKELPAPRAAPTATQADPSGYRLPTEAEWEFACRAGTTTRCWLGNDRADLIAVGWFAATSGGRTHAVGELPANPFGLFDMHGNVMEMLRDWSDPTYYAQFQDQPAVNPLGPETGSQRVLRGGNWSWHPFGGRSANRGQVPPDRAEHTRGFRAALSWEAVKRSMTDGAAAERP